MSQFSRRHTKRSMIGIAIIVILASTFSIIVLPNINPSSQFSSVVWHINQDSRNPAPLTYLKPNTNDSLGWSIAEYHWRHGLSIDWEQVDYFLTELEYHNVTGYWCDSHQNHPDDVTYYWFVWFQVSNTEFAFLYPYGYWY